MDKRLRAAVLILSINLNLAGPAVTTALADAQPISLTLPTGLKAGDAATFQLGGWGVTVSHVTFSLQLRSGQAPDSNWQLITDDTDSSDGFSANWQAQPGEYWVQAVASDSNGVVGTDTQPLTVVTGSYHLHGSVATGTSNRSLSIRIEGSGVDLYADNQMGDQGSTYGGYAVQPQLDIDGQPVPGQFEYYFDVPAGTYKLIITTDRFEARQDVQTTGTQVVDTPHGPYWDAVADLQPDAHGPWIQPSPINPPPAPGVTSVVSTGVQVADGRSVTALTMRYQAQVDGQPLDDTKWTDLTAVDNQNGTYSANWTPPNAGNYGIRIDATDSAGTHTWNDLFIMAQVVYELHGTITLNGLTKDSVTVELHGPMGAGPVGYNPNPAPDAPAKLTDVVGPNGVVPDQLAYSFRGLNPGDYNITATSGSLIVMKPVTVQNTATALDLQFAAPGPLISFPPPGGPAPMVGQPMQLQAAVNPQPNTTVQSVNFSVQPQATGTPPDPTKWTAVGPGVSGPNGYATGWTPAKDGDYWVNVEAVDSLGNKSSNCYGIHVDQAHYQIFGGLGLAPNVDKQSVAVRIQGNNVDRTLPYNPTPDPMQFEVLTDSKDQNGQPMPGLSFGFDVPPGSYTLTASGNTTDGTPDVLDTRTVTVTGSQVNLGGMNLPPMLPRPQFTFTDGAPDHVYFSGNTLALDLTGLDAIADGTVVMPALTVNQGPDHLPAPIAWAAQGAVQGGQLHLSGPVGFSDGQQPVSGSLQFQLLDAGTQKPLSDMQPMGAPGVEPAWFLAPEQGVQTTPDLSAIPDFHQTTEPLTITRGDLSIKFGAGLNLLERMPNDILHAVNLFSSPGGFNIQLQKLNMPSLATQSAIITIGRIGATLNLPDLTADNWTTMLKISTADADGNPGNYVDPAQSSYDAATDTLTLAVTQLGSVNVNPAARMWLSAQQIDMHDFQPQLWANLPEPLTTSALPGVTVADSGGVVIQDAVAAGTVSLSVDPNNNMPVVSFHLKSGLAAGKYTVVVTADGKSWSAGFSVWPGVTLSPGPVVEQGYPGGTQLFASNFGTMPIKAGAAVKISIARDGQPAQPDATVTAIQQQDGSVAVPVTLNAGLTAGYYDLHFSVDGVPGDVRTDLQVAMPSNVQLTLLDAAQHPMTDTDVHLRKVGAQPGDPDADAGGFTGPDGIVRLQLPAGVAYSLVEVRRQDTVISLNVPVMAPTDGSKLTMNVPVAFNTALTVTDPDGLPITDAGLSLHPDDGQGHPVMDQPPVFAMTNSTTGTARLQLQPGSYHLTAIISPEQIINTDFMFTVDANGYQGAFQLPKPNVLVTVRDLAGNLMTHAHVQFRPAGATDGTQSVWADTDDQGVAAVKLPDAAAWVIFDIGTPDAVLTVKKAITVPAEGADPLTMNLAVGNNVQLTIKDWNGQPMYGAGLSLVPDDGQGHPVMDPAASIWARTGDTTGSAKLWLDPGSYHLVGIGTGDRHIITNYSFTVDPANGYQGAFQLPKPNVLVTIHDRTGQLLANAMVQFRPAGATDDHQSVWAETDAQGVAAVKLPEGAFWEIFDVSASGQPTPVEKTITVPAAGANALTLSLVVGTNVQLTLQDEDGALMPAASVVICRDVNGLPAFGDGNVFNLRTNASGVLSGNLDAGTYHVTEVDAFLRQVKTDLAFTVADPGGYTGTLQLPQQDVKITLQGEDGTPVAGAMVQLRPKDRMDDYTAGIPVQTDGKGVARINLPRGAGYVLIDVGTKDGVYTLRREFTVATAGVTDLTYPVWPNVAAPLYDEQDQLMYQANVMVKPDDGNGSPVADGARAIGGKVGTDGMLRLDLAPGVWHIVDVSTPTRHVSTDIKLTVGTTKLTAPIHLPKPNVILTVTGDGGLAISHAMVQVRPADAPATQPSIWVETDQAGVARAILTPGVRYKVVDISTASGIRPVAKEFTLPNPAPTAPMPVGISLAANVAAAVLDEAGTPITFAGLSIRPDDGNGSPVDAPDRSLFVSTDANGSFSVNLDPGTYHLVDIGNQVRQIHTDIRFQVDGTTGFHASLRVPAPNLRLTIKNGSLPVVRAWVQLRPVTTTANVTTVKSAWVQTDQNGIAMALLPAGVRYTVVDVSTPNGVIRVGKEFTPGTALTDLPISLAANLNALLKDEGGAVMAGAGVTIRPDDGNSHPVTDYSRAIYTNTNNLGQLAMNLDPGTYHITEVGTAARFVRTDIMFTITSGGSYTTDLQLPPPNVRVTVSDDNGPVRKAWIQLRPAAAGPADYDKAIWAQTDDNGAVRVQLAAATNWLVVDVGTAAGVNHVNKAFTTPSGNPANPLDVPVSLSANVDVTLLDYDQVTPLAGAHVTIRPVGQDGTAVAGYETATFASTDGQGHLKVNLAPGSYKIVEVGTSQRYLKTEIPFTVSDSGLTGSLHLPLPNTAITVTLGGSPVGNAWVQVRPAGAPADQPDKSLWIQTDAAGVARMQLSAATQYVIVDVGTMQGVTPVGQAFTTPADSDPTPVAVAISLTANVTGTVLDEHSAPLANASLTIRPDGQSAAANYFAKTDDNGQFAVNLPAGAYHVVEIGAPERFIRTSLAIDATGGTFGGTLALPAVNFQATVKNGPTLLGRAVLQIRPAGARPDDYSQRIWVETDQFGVATTTLPDGNYVLIDVGTPSGVTPVNKAFAVPGADNLTVDLAPNVTAKLLDENGSPMSGAWLTVKPEAGGDTRTITANTDGSGTFRLTLDAGSYRITEVGKQGRYLRTNIPLVVTTDGYTDGDVQLAQPNQTGSVVLNGQAVPYAKVAVAPAAADPNDPTYWDSVIWFAADATGHLTMALPNGNYVIRDVDTPTHWYKLNTPVNFTLDGSAQDPVQVDLTSAQ